jgi:DNA polymerase elongation subunit (family B)
MDEIKSNNEIKQFELPPKLKDRNILIFDIETYPCDFNTYFDDDTKNYLLKSAKDEEQKTELIDKLSFSPFSSCIAAIGMLDFKKYIGYTENGTDRKGCVLLHNNDSGQEVRSDDGAIIYECGNEKDVLKKFWEIVARKKYNLFVTFNGRDFDCPYLMLRSLILKIRPTFNLMKGSDFNLRNYHIDLRKELKYSYRNEGAGRGFTFDFYCKQLGIPSPKADGVSGAVVAELYREKKFKEIADYCIKDVIAGAELFKYWLEIMFFPDDFY